MSHTCDGDIDSVVEATPEADAAPLLARARAVLMGETLGLLVTAADGETNAV